MKLRSLLLVLPLLAACGATHEEGISLAVSAKLAATGTTEDSGAGVKFTRADGAEIVLEKGYVTLTRLELVRCPETTWNHFLRALSPIGTAHAHGSDNPRILEAARVLMLDTHRTTALELHPMKPPAARYCGAKLTLSPADEHTHGMPEGVELVGRTVKLSGTIKPSGSATAEPFQLEATGSGTQELTFEALELNGEALAGALVLALAFDRWLENVTVADGEAGMRAFDNVLGSASVSSSR